MYYRSYIQYQGGGFLSISSSTIRCVYIEECQILPQIAANHSVLNLVAPSGFRNEKTLSYQHGAVIGETKQIVLSMSYSGFFLYRYLFFILCLMIRSITEG